MTTKPLPPELEAFLVDALKLATPDQGQFVHRHDSIPGYHIPTSVARQALQWLASGATPEQRQAAIFAALPAKPALKRDSVADTTAALLASLTLDFQKDQA